MANAMNIFEKINAGAYHPTTIYLTLENKKERLKLSDQFESDLFKEFGVENNPKARLAYRIAEEMANGSGLYEIAINFQTIVELIQ